MALGCGSRDAAARRRWTFGLSVGLSAGAFLLGACSEEKPETFVPPEAKPVPVLAMLVAGDPPARFRFRKKDIQDFDGDKLPIHFFELRLTAQSYYTLEIRRPKATKKKPADWFPSFAVLSVAPSDLMDDAIAEAKPLPEPQFGTAKGGVDGVFARRIVAAKKSGEYTLRVQAPNAGVKGHYEVVLLRGRHSMTAMNIPE